MAVILPIASLILLLLISSHYCHLKREALLIGLLAWGVILTVLTEILSLVGWLNAGFLTAAWLLVTVGLAYFLRQVFGPKFLQSISKKWLRLNSFFEQPLIQNLLIVGVIILLLIIGTTALVAAPNHSDSMEYHLSRVMHWIQNASVAHYPTHNLFHLYQNPFSEFAIANLQILSNSDRFSGSVQWVSMIGSIFGVSLIAKELGARRTGQILAAIFVATLPMAILQGSSTNNDHVVSLWIVCFVYFSLVIMRQGIKPLLLVCLGASLGLAILTKGTAYIYAFPFCIWLLVWGIKRLGWRMVKPMAGVVAIVLAINAGHYLRNLGLFSSPLGAPGGEIVGIFGLNYFISNIVKNLALHADIVRNLHLENLITPTTGLTSKVVSIIHNIIGVDVSEPLLTSPKVSGFYVPGLSFNEDNAVNPLHLAIILVSSGLLLINRDLGQRRQLFLYWLTTTSAFLLFCLLLTWSPFRCRLHLTIFILFGALVGTVIGNSFNRNLTYLLSFVLLLLSFQWALYNSIRPLMSEDNIFVTPRTAQYFTTQESLTELYTNAATEVENQSCSNIGMVFESISFEYPYWLLFDASRPDFKIQHVNVNNSSKSLEVKPAYSEFEPCLVIKTASLSPDTLLEPEIRVGEKVYQEIWQQEKKAKSSRKSVQLFSAE